MSKIKVNEIESSSTNVKLAAKGSKIVKVQGAGGADGTLQLTSGTHSVKIKSPAHSAGQSYTMVLPDNNIETDKFLRVKSVTGSGATATNQLEYATITEPDITALNATNITSGTVPAARFGTSISASVGALQLVSKTTVGSTAVSSIDLTGFESGYHYLLIAKKLIQDGTPANYVYLDEYQADGSNFYRSGNIVMGGTGYLPYNTTFSCGVTYVQPGQSSQSGHKQLAFVAEINNAATRGTMLINAMHMGYNQNITWNYFQGFIGTCNADQYLHTMKIKPVYSSWNFIQGSEVLLYRYGKI